MENNHLTYFKVENFKKFESLEVNDIGQFNLIVGDNNVGKTCLLEALLFDEDGEQLISNFWIGLTKRGMFFESKKVPYEINGKIFYDYEFPQGNYFEKFEFVKHKPVEFCFKISLDCAKKISISLIGVGGNKLSDENPEFKIPFTNHIAIINDKPFNVYNYDRNISNFPLIAFNDNPLEEETKLIYENFKTKKQKQTLINVLKVVNPNISDIELSENFENLKSVFLISFEDKDEFVPLNFLGDGFKRIFYIILKTISLKGKRIMIDEIEIGIHHSKIKDFWVNIFKVCKELDVQLFATTHSDECSEAFVEAAKSLDSNIQSGIRLIELYESKEKVYSGTISGAENIEYSVKNEPFRGENIYG